MREAARILAQLEASAMKAMRPAYALALITIANGGDAEEEWVKFRAMFERAYVVANLIGRLDIQNGAERAGGVRKYSVPFMTASWDKAISLFLRKVPIARRLLDTLIPVARAKAFFVTGVESEEAVAKIQEKIADRLAGQPEQSPFVQSVKVELAQNLSHARLETVLRTNVMTALNEGAMDETRSLGDSVALLMLNEVHDQRTRGAPGGLYADKGFHWQMDGFVETPGNPVWGIIRPPNGFNCRAYISVVGWLKAQRMGLANAAKRTVDAAAVTRYNGRRWDYIRSGKYPDKGFGEGKAAAAAA